MDATASLYEWAGGALVARPDEPAQGGLLVADSFLVAEGRALGLGMHRARFAESAREQGHDDPAGLARFWDAAVGMLPATGLWFPRLELADGLCLRLRLRPAPPLGETLVVATAADDPRRTPHLKGPDIPALAGLRGEAQRHGAEEAVLLDGGRVADGATTALLWWRGDTLFAPPFALPRVDSVAARTVRGIAAALGVPVEEEAVRPAELAGATLWAVNALHGVREVTAWVDGPALARDAARTAAWRARFAALARPVG